MTALITLTAAGADTGPFNLYSNIDGYATPFESGVPKASLVAGYTSSVVPDYANYIRVKSTGNCTTFTDIEVPFISTFVKTGESSTIQTMNVYGTLTIKPNTNFEWSVNLFGTFNPFQLSDSFNTYPTITTSGLTTGVANSGPTGILGITILLSTPLGVGISASADVGFYEVGSYPSPMLPDGFQLLSVEQ